MTIRPATLLPLVLMLAMTPMFAHGEDLMDAYRQALANDPVLAQQAAERNVTEQGVPLARAPLLPQLSAGWRLQQTNGSGVSRSASNQAQSSSGNGYTRSRNLSLDLTQTIVDFSKYANLDAAQAQAASADAQYDAALQDLIVRVSTAYFTVLLAKDQVANAEASEKQLARQLDRANALFKNGLSAITDVQDAKAQHDAAVAELITARNQLDDSREALSQITGQPVENLKVLSNQLPMTPPSPETLSTWVTQATARNPNILAQQFAVAAAGHDIKAARDQRLPTLDANVSYGRGASWAQDGPYFDQPNNTTFGLTVNVPLFSGGAIHAQIKQSIYQRNAAQAILTQQKRLVVRNTRNHFRSVLAGISKVEATHQGVESAKSALAATEAGYNVGTRTIVDVLLAQQNLTAARQSYSQARHEFILDKLLLEQDSGSLNVKDLTSVNALLVPAGSIHDVATKEDGSTSK